MASRDPSKSSAASLGITRAHVLGGGVTILATLGASAGQASKGVPAPSGGQVPRFKGAARSSDWITLVPHIGGHLCVKVTVNGRESLAVLDSGAARTAIDRRLADDLGLVASGAMGAAGLTGNTVLPLVGGVTIETGQMAVEVVAAVADLSAVFSGVFDAPEVVLGYDVFDALDVDLDLPRGRVAFHLSAPDERPPGSTELPLQVGQHRARYVPVSIEGVEVSAIYDLGSNVPIYISPELAAAMGLFKGRPVSTALSAGVEGRSVDQVLTLTEVKLGDIRLTKVPAAVPPAWANEAPAVVGAPLLSRFRTLISFRRALVILTPDARAVNALFLKDRSGIGARRMTDRLQVVHVAPGSPAEAAGLVAGDEIVAVNEESLDAAFYRRNPRLGAMAPGTIHELRLSNGRELQVVLQDYY